MDCPHTLSARYYAQITSTQYRPSGLRQPVRTPTLIRVFAAGLFGMAGFVALVIMIGAML